MSETPQNIPDDPRVDDGGRQESDSERSDRNWIDLLQELRVLQAGTQILTAFLLAIAFQPRFERSTSYWRRFRSSRAL
jgi:hypothetical protein